MLCCRTRTCHINADVINLIKDKAGLPISIPSHTTRILMTLDNKYNHEFAAKFRELGGLEMMADVDPPRWKLCEVIHKADVHAQSTITPVVAENCGWAPWGPEKPLERLAKEGRTLQHPNGAPAANSQPAAASAAALGGGADGAGTLSASDLRRQNKEQSATYKADQDLWRLLAERVLQLDRKIHDTLLRVVVAPAEPREGEIQISGEKYAQFLAWEEKKRAKKERDQMSTQGQLLSEAQFLDKMEADKKRKREDEEKTEANKQAREERAEAKVVEEHEKQKAHAERLASEAVVRDLLKSCDCWTSKKGYVMVGDMDKFIKTYRNELKKLSKYGAKMSASDKLALLEQATDECDASVFARRSGRRR
jgi:hypothetical protein